MAGSTSALISSIATTGTDATVWAVTNFNNATASGKKFTVNNSITLTGTDGTTMTFPATNQTVSSLAGTETLTNKQITPRVTTIASSATPTPTASTDDEYTITALAAGATFGSPGTGVEGQKLLIRVKDNGGAQTLAWNAVYRASTDLSLPTTTVASKTMYIMFINNITDSKWDLVSVLGNF
jgi:hypothetical protein